MSIIPHKHVRVVFGIQAARDVEAAGALVTLPLPEGADLETNKNYSFFQYAAGHYGLKHYETGGEWVEGRLRLPLVPGYVVATGDLYNWIWGRDAVGYHQGYWATLYRDMGNGLIERFLNCKVTGGTIVVDFGADYAAVDLNITGIRTPEADTVAGDVDTIFEVRPYRFSEAGVTVDGNADNVTRNHAIEFNNMTEDPAGMGTLNGSVYPYDLPNAAKAQWSGSFDRIFNNTSVYADFRAGLEASYTLVLTRAAVAVCTITMPRILWTADPLPIPDSGIVRETGINFQALESLDGATDACTISEAAP